MSKNTAAKTTQTAQHEKAAQQQTPPKDEPKTLPFEVQHTPLLHDGARYLPGDVVELTVEQAEAQGGNVAPVAPPAPSNTEPKKD